MLRVTTERARTAMMMMMMTIIMIKVKDDGHSDDGEEVVNGCVCGA